MRQIQVPDHGRLTSPNEDFIVPYTSNPHRNRTMSLTEQIKPIIHFTDNPTKAIAELAETRQPLIITQNGEATCVIQGIKSYEEERDTMALLKLLLSLSASRAKTSASRRFAFNMA